jgi:hypothetical protein
MIKTRINGERQAVKDVVVILNKNGNNSRSIAMAEKHIYDNYMYMGKINTTKTIAIAVKSIEVGNKIDRLQRLMSL